MTQADMGVADFKAPAARQLRWNVCGGEMFANAGVAAV